MALKKTSTPLEEWIDSVLVKFSMHYPQQDVHVQIPDEFVVIPMVAMLIEQVLINLLENAVMHVQGMTELRLKVSLEGKQAAFCVEEKMQRCAHPGVVCPIHGKR